jgi:hypothetical protein
MTQIHAWWYRAVSARMNHTFALHRSRLLTRFQQSDGAATPIHWHKKC